jgi:hypothetical protein
LEPASSADASPSVPSHPVTGMLLKRVRVDSCDMIWPVAALAVFVLCFVVVYGSFVQSRLDAGRSRNDSRRARQDIAR